jgi:hypothetical protein
MEIGRVADIEHIIFLAEQYVDAVLKLVHRIALYPIALDSKKPFTAA